MYYVKMTALRPLCGDYGKPNTGEAFTTDNMTADSLAARGLAETYRDPNAPSPAREFLAKMFGPPENKMIQPAANKSDWEADPEPFPVVVEQPPVAAAPAVEIHTQVSPRPHPKQKGRRW